MTDLIIDNADKAKIDAVFVDGNYLCVQIIQYRCGCNSTCMCPHLILLYSYSYVTVSIYVSSYLILYNYSYMCIYLLICVLFAQVPHVPPLPRTKIVVRPRKVLVARFDSQRSPNWIMCSKAGCSIAALFRTQHNHYTDW
jgi:hypothetical protein